MTRTAWPYLAVHGRAWRSDLADRLTDMAAWRSDPPAALHGSGPVGQRYSPGAAVGGSVREILPAGVLRPEAGASRSATELLEASGGSMS